jgi:competence protein ComEC
MIGAALSFACGVVAERYVFHPPWYWLACAVLLAFCSLAALSRRQRIAYAAALFVVGCAGGFCAQAHNSYRPSPAPGARLAQFANHDEITITGTVMHDGVLRQGAMPDESVDIAVETVSTDSGVVNVDGGVRLTIYVPSRRRADDDSNEEDSGSAAMPVFTYGQRLELVARLRPPINYKNPGAFDYVGYLREHDIQVLGSAKLPTVRVLSEDGSRWERWRAAARRSVVKQIHHIWTDEEAALFAAMVIGDKAFLSRGTRAEYQRSGTYHILVVSGMNVAIFATFLFWTLRRTRAGAGVAMAMTLFVTVGYALLTDLGPPVLRSVLMIAAYQATRFLYRDRNPLNGVGVASLGLLAWNPSLVFDASFQMTILAVFAIAALAVPLIERSSGPYRRGLRQLFVVGYDQAFEPKLAQWRIDLRMIAERLSMFFGRRIGRGLVKSCVDLVLMAFELVLVSLLLQLAMALPMVWYFHRLPFHAFYANLAVVPLTSVLMPAAMLAIAVSYASAHATIVPAKIASWALAGITGTVHTFGAVAIQETRLALPTVASCVLAAMGLVLAMLLVRRRPVLCAAGLVTLLVSSLWLAQSREHLNRRAGEMEITAIDVGQGESLLIITPDGRKLLLDSGGMLGFSRSEFDIGEEVTSPYLWQRGIQRLDAVAFSHPHSDHIGGMRAIIANFRPREIWLAPNAPSALYMALMKTCIDYGVGARIRTAGQQFDWGGAHWQVLSPSADEAPSRVTDDTSMVLRVSVGASSALLPGDIHRKVERELSREVRSDLLKVPHHGSATSTSPELLENVTPRWALISAGVNNQFRHPRTEVLQRLAAAHVRTYRTDLMGPVTFYLDGRELRPSVPR